MPKKKQDESLYHMIQEDLKKKIRYMELRENERIMSEAEICKHYGVSRITAVRALNNLADEGYIRRIPGKGSFVNYHIVELHTSKYYSLTEETMRWGMIPSSKYLDRRIITVRESEHARELMDKIYLSEEDEVLYIKRLRYADGVIIAIDVSYLPTMRLSDKEKKELVDSDYHFIDSIDTKMRRRGSMPTRVNESFSIAYLSKEDATHFNVPANTPVIKVARITYLDSEMLEYHIHLCQGAKFNYRVEIKNVDSPRQTR